jgi:NTP pyrophosphatase (non-canonical NTP hydrolase)|nr:MAG TPA: NTP-PPase-like protein [Caudoviricetes sp.]
MNLNELRDRAYQTACDHGFHDEELSNEHCLCLVISELMEAVEADRKGRSGKKCKSRFEMDYNRYPALVEEEKRFKCSFEKNVKDSLPDELADAVIRLLDLAGLRNFNLNRFSPVNVVLRGKTFTENIYAIVKEIMDSKYSLEEQVNYVITQVFALADILGVDLLWHINQKIRYNELRENKHGKKY